MLKLKIIIILTCPYNEQIYIEDIYKHPAAGFEHNTANGAHSEDERRREWLEVDPAACCLKRRASSRITPRGGQTLGAPRECSKGSHDHDIARVCHCRRYQGYALFPLIDRSRGLFQPRILPKPSDPLMAAISAICPAAGAGSVDRRNLYSRIGTHFSDPIILPSWQTVF